MNKKKFLSFRRARAEVRKIGFKNTKDYKKRRGNYDILKKIPWDPKNYYGEWIDWYDWLGTKKRAYMPFKKARLFVRKLNLKGYKEWKKYCKSGSKPDNIPAHPVDYYKEYKNSFDWLGTNEDRRAHMVVDDFFSHWSHDMSYVLGFWFADGNIYVRGQSRIFSITQNTKDRYLLEKISKTMGSTFPIYDGIMPGGSCYSKISIRSNKIVKDIIKLGGKERKSLDVKFPNVPKKYLPDFIRGLWDGDGTVYSKRQNDGKMHSRASILSGSGSFIKGLRKILEKNVKNLSARIYTQYVYKGDKIFGKALRTKDNHYYTLSLSANNARRLRDYMYKNKGMCLKRKHSIFLGLGAMPKRIKYMSYQRAVRYIKKLNLKNRKEWKKFARSKRRPQNIPRCPFPIYKNKGWKGMNKWINKPPLMLSFEKARKIARSLGFKKYKEWRNYAKASKRPRNIPHSPDITYKNKGWINYRDWLGCQY